MLGIEQRLPGLEAHRAVGAQAPGHLKAPYRILGAAAEQAVDDDVAVPAPQPGLELADLVTELGRRIGEAVVQAQDRGRIRIPISAGWRYIFLTLPGSVKQNAWRRRRRRDLLWNGTRAWRRAMTSPLWQPSPERVAAANMTAFADAVASRHGQALPDYGRLRAWSVEHLGLLVGAVAFCGGPRQQAGGPGSRPRRAHAGCSLVRRCEAQLRREPAALRDDRPAMIAWSEDASAAASASPSSTNRLRSWRLP